MHSEGIAQDLLAPIRNVCAFEVHSNRIVVCGLKNTDQFSMNHSFSVCDVYTLGDTQNLREAEGPEGLPLPLVISPEPRGAWSTACAILHFDPQSSRAVVII